MKRFLLLSILALTFGGSAQATFPTVAATNTSTTSPASTSHTLNLPTGIASGDLLIAIFAVNNNPTVTWPTGWTQVVAKAGIGSSYRTEIRCRTADGTEGASISLTTSTSQTSAHGSYRITGQAGGACETIAVASTGAQGTSTTYDPDNLSPGWTDDTLWLALGVPDGGVTVTGAPANYTNLLTSATADIATGSSRRELNAASENPGTGTLSGFQDWDAFTLAVKPAAAGGAAAKRRVIVD